VDVGQHDRVRRASTRLLTAFVVIELRQRAPLVRLDIFRVRTLRAANLTMLLVASGPFAMFFFNWKLPFGRTGRAPSAATA